MSSGPFVFSQLPPELLREVFEHAAQSDTKTALALSLVSSWTRQWVEPLLYHTVVLSTAPALRSFANALSHKPSTFAHDRVKNLGIFAQGPVQSIEQVLDACTGVDSLACGFTVASTKQLQSHPAIQSPDCPKEQHLLGMACRDGWDPTIVAPSVTHLRVHLPSSPNARLPIHRSNSSNEEQEVTGWDVLSNLPALTHLAIVYRPSKDYPIDSIFLDLQHLLEAPPQSSSSSDHTAEDSPNSKPDIHLILVQVAGLPSAQSSAVKTLNDAALEAGGESLRIVAERAPSSAVVQWEEAVREGKSVWQDAEEVVKKRMSKEKEEKAVVGAEVTH
ncbi:hypothetical protein K474DRAFT_1295357 [Panus rudis PR-1116 ss-1]|nr:hypothetical protein K474DRAFT_1295357 [Panus rudis PR-1116 ss-1]